MIQVAIFLIIFMLLLLAQISWIWFQKNRLTLRSSSISSMEDKKRYVRFMNNFGQRLSVSWVVSIAFAMAFLAGFSGITVLFLLLSFLAFRELMSIINVKAADYWSLLFSFYIFLPLQYFFIWMDWTFLFYIFIPIYGFLLSPILATMADDCDNFFERAAKFQWAQVACIYCLSYAPAIAKLSLNAGQFESSSLLLFLLMVVSISDAFQYVCGSVLGRKKIAPKLSPNKTWEGTLLGIAIACIVGMLLYKLTPFTQVQALFIALLVCIVGFLGGLVMSAIKRSLKIKDWGDILGAHGGILDRFDSLIFTAPLFYHMCRYFYS